MWKTIPGYEGFYEVSDMGDVRSSDRLVHTSNGITQRRKGRTLKPALSAGYPFVLLQVACERKQIHVHRLVASAFCDKPEGCDVVNHIDGIKTNNAASNLEWTTYSGNAKHAYDTGLNKAKYRQDHNNSKLTQFQVDQIRGMLISGKSGSSIARELGVHVMTISNIRNGRSWSTCGNPMLDECKSTASMSNKGEDHPGCKLSESDVICILDKLSMGIPQKVIARGHGITQATVSLINTGKTWGHLPR